jgi:hypothetical protein
MLWAYVVFAAEVVEERHARLAVASRREHDDPHAHLGGVYEDKIIWVGVYDESMMIHTRTSLIESEQHVTTNERAISAICHSRARHSMA